VESNADGRRIADNQALFRDVNDRIEELNRHFDMFTPYGSWACECASIDCIERIEMTLAEYEQLREHPLRFAVAPAPQHLALEHERVVARGDRYWVVEKEGTAATRAAERHTART
jgi:hypothetical protein